MKVLITGGAGFIGSTVASACADTGMTPVILDDLSTGRSEFVKDRAFYYGDISDAGLVRRVFDEHPEIEAVIHCAGKIVVPESVAQPLVYYRENVAKTIALVEVLAEVGCERLIFSSSASVYGPSATLSVDERSPVAPASPYARTKMVTELILRDAATAGQLRSLALRYFNPIGADPRLRSGLQTSEPTHVLGKLITADHLRQPFVITGGDWPTRDGTGIRDYIHVWDLARAHVAALRHFDRALAGDSFGVVNLGTGSDTTVRELVDAFAQVRQARVAVQVADRRPGDLAGCFARTDKAHRVLSWRAQLSIADGIHDALAWVAHRPTVLGY